MRIIDGAEFDAYWKNHAYCADDAAVTDAVRSIIGEVRKGGDEGVRKLAARLDKSSPYPFAVPEETLRDSWTFLKKKEPELALSLELAKDHIGRFAEQQRKQFADFDYEVTAGVIAGQRVIPVEKAGVYVPAGRFPLISSVLMGVIPALAAGVGEVVAASPPLEDGLPAPRIMAAAYLAGAKQVFAIGGAQAVAALALGTESVPRVDVIVGPGNKYVAAAKRLLFGEVGIDFVAGPTDVLIVAGEGADADVIAADMLAQAEHDPDARARVLVGSVPASRAVAEAVEKRLGAFPAEKTACASLDAGGLIVIYHNKEEAVRIANAIAPEHLELQGVDVEAWEADFRNYGALFIGETAAEVLGDYSAGTNHTLPTSGTSRFSGGLSVRHFLKTVTSLRCTKDSGYEKTAAAAKVIAGAEGLVFHAESARLRQRT
jgi:histidinol dehydrogenase